MTSGNAIPGSKRAVMSGRNGVHEGTLPQRKGGGNWGRKDFDWTSMTMNRRSNASSRGGRLFRIPGEKGRWRTTPPAVLSHLFGLLRHRPGLALRHQFLQVGPLALGRSGVMRHDSRSEEHTSELQSLMRISYAVFCLKKKNTQETDKYT